MNTALDALLQNSRIWRGERRTWTDTDCLTSGFTELDAILPGGGWPRGALTEIMLPRHGVGELRMLLPALVRLTREAKWIALIAPPYIPYAQAWHALGLDLSHLLWVHPRTPSDHLWAVEQALRAGTCGAVIGWPAARTTFQQLRRLQLAAETGRSWGVLFRPAECASQATPAAVRVQVSPSAQGLAVHLLKRRGAWAGEAVQLRLPLHAAIS